MKTKLILLNLILTSIRKYLVPKESVQEPADVPAARPAMGCHTSPKTSTRRGTHCPSTGGEGHRLSALLTLPRLVPSGQPQADLQIADGPFHTLFQLATVSVLCHPHDPAGFVQGALSTKGVSWNWMQTCWGLNNQLLIQALKHVSIPQLHIGPPHPGAPTHTQAALPL